MDLDIVEWVKKEFGISLMPYQEELLRKMHEAQRRGEILVYRKGMFTPRYVPDVPARSCGKRALVTIIDEFREEEPNEQTS